MNITIQRIIKASNSLLLLAACCFSLSSPVQAGSSVAPPQAQSYGLSRAELLKIKYTPRTSNLVGNIWFISPLEPGVPTGSGTIADPLILEGHGEITVKSGISIYSDLISFFGESYEGGGSDPVLPDAWWAQYVSGSAWIDGKKVVADGNAYYVSPQIFDPEIIYAEPTDYGAISLNFVQGCGFLIRPMAVGVHTLTQEAAVLAPADNGLIPETAIIFRYSWTITIVP